MTDEAWLTEFWRLAEAWRCTVKSRDYFAAKEALSKHLAVREAPEDHEAFEVLRRMGAESFRLRLAALRKPEYESDEHD